jgi:predicted transcriptional regulator
MTSEQYKQERVRRGLSVMQLAEKLGVHWVTVYKREAGVHRVSEEAAVAIRALPVPRARKAPETAPKK